MKLSSSEQITYCTVRIECEFDNGTGTGTGFFFMFLKDAVTGNHVPVVITNKHVICGAKRGRLISQNGPLMMPRLDTEHFEIYLDNFESLWRKHPNDDVDLCAMPIAPFLNHADKMGERLFYISFDMSIIPSKQQIEELSALEEILTVGNPPVFLYNKGEYQDKHGNTYMRTNRIYLIGILFADPQQTVQGEVQIINIPTGQRQVTYSNIPINLGLIIKSERIIELEQLFKIQ